MAEANAISASILPSAQIHSKDATGLVRIRWTRQRHWWHFVALVERDYNFSARVAGFQIADGFAEFTERVGFVEDWNYSSGFQEIAKNGEVVLAGLGEDTDEF